MAILQTNVQELLNTFRDTLVSLVPIVERVQMRWKDPDNYDDWDNICNALYSSIVLQSILHAKEAKNCLKIAPYDISVLSYADLSYITDKKSSNLTAFVGFCTTNIPFDTCLFSLLDNKRKVVSKLKKLHSDVEFAFVCNLGKEVNIIRNLTVAL